MTSSPSLGNSHILLLIHPIGHDALGHEARRVLLHDVAYMIRAGLQVPCLLNLRLQSAGEVRGLKAPNGAGEYLIHLLQSLALRLGEEEKDVDGRNNADGAEYEVEL